MKKLFFLLTASILLVSCSDDDNETPSIQGTWKLTAFTVSEPVDFNNDGIGTTNLMTESNCYDNSSIFLAPGNVASVVLQESEVELILVSGTTNEYEYTSNCFDGDLLVGIWSQSNNNVTITIDNDPLTLTVSGNTMSVVIPQFVEVITNNGTSFEVTDASATLVFTKQ